ncbi:Receptor-like protein 52 [Linum perenne]
MSLLSLVPLILPVLIVSSHVPLVFGRCREDQQSLLVQLKGGLNFTDSISVKLARWNVSTDCCEWPGISCDVGGLGRVIGLDLSGEWINGGGGLDDSMTLFSLQYLERLDLSYNEFNTTIPAALANLTNLRYMDLSNADFFGKIPASISQLTSLTSLNLSCWVSCVKKLEISNLALLVQNLTQLTHLRLDGVNLSAQIPDSLAELKNLTTLRMANCGLIGTFPKKIAQSLTLLEYLDLSNNQLQGPIPRSIFELSSLDTLSLSSNRFSGSVQLSWIHTLQNLKNLDLSNNNLIVDANINNSSTSSTFPRLYTLDFSHNRFNGSFPTETFNNQHSVLSFLSLSNNRFIGIIPTSICNASFLQVVDFSNNNLNDTIPSCLLKDLKKLSVLDLRGNMLTGKIPDTFQTSSALQTLDLSNNQLQGRIPESLENCTMLAVNTKGLEWEFEKILTIFKSIDLSSNNFDGPIPEIIGKFKALHVLNLSHNAFTGNIPSVIGDLSNLESLDLSYNKLSGHIPMELVGLTFLAVMNLSDNYLVGSIPTELQSLSILELDYNNFSSPLPDSLAEFKNLTYLSMKSCGLIGTFSKKIAQSLTLLETLDLSNNQLQGPIPRSIFELPSLRVLFLSSNRFRGSVQLHRFSFSRLQLLDKHDNQLEGNFPSIPSSSYVDFSHNHFSGSFLTEFFNNQYTRLTFLSLSNNRLTGIIPTSICNHAGLEVVDFSNNYLNGTIPSCLSKDLNELSVLDLRRNMLSGNILNTFQVSCALQTLDLSNNQLEGIFPESLENCTNLEVLDIGYNKISDVFPCIQGIKSSLHVLILRNNLFHGSLWCRYGDLTTWQQLQIVDLAFNNFTGPLNDKFLLTWEAMMQDGKGTKDRIKFNSDSSGYYHNSITVSMKGLNLEFVKILTVFKSIDLSSNNFVGPIPEVIGKFKAIQVLNLSHNAFSGQIPSEFGNLSNVESLDLSHNKLTGQIPNELTGLTFLSCMDLSYNNLVGRIPTGTQFQSFDNTSFGGNLDLCGQPLSKSCTDPPTLSGIIVSHEKSSIRINWDILSKVFGFFCGLALIMLPASLWPSFRIWYWPKIDSVILWMFPKLYVKDWNNRLSTRQTRRRNKRTKATQ